jgi:small ubiquitin-related modifier
MIESQAMEEDKTKADGTGTGPSPVPPPPPPMAAKSAPALSPPPPASAAAAAAKAESAAMVATQEHINLRVHDANGQETFFKIKKTTPLLKLFTAYATRIGQPTNAFRFLYDGLRLADTDTPLSRDMVDQDTIDVMVSQTGGGESLALSYTLHDLQVYHDKGWPSIFMTYLMSVGHVRVVDVDTDFPLVFVYDSSTYMFACVGGPAATVFDRDLGCMNDIQLRGAAKQLREEIDFCFKTFYSLKKNNNSSVARNNDSSVATLSQAMQSVSL